MKRSVMFLLIIGCFFGLSAQLIYPPKNKPYSGYYYHGLRKFEYIYCGLEWQAKFKHGPLDLILGYPIAVFCDTGEIYEDGWAYVMGCDTENYELGDTIMLYSEQYGRYYPLPINGVTELKSTIKNITSARIGFDYQFPHSLAGLSGLKEIQLGPLYKKNYTSFPNCSGCYALTHVTIPDFIKSIPIHGFIACENLITVELHDSIEAIGDSAFMMSGIEYIKLPSSIKKIPDYTFYECKKLQKVELPKHCVTIGKYAFENCPNLQNVIWPDTAFTIGEYAFSRTGFKSLQLPTDFPIKIGKYAFRNSSLSELNIPKNNWDMDYGMFANCKNLKTLVLEPGLKSLGKGMFYGCSSISDLTFPTSMTRISEEAFRNCTGLRKIDFPDWITSIGNKSFYGCSNLLSVTFKLEHIGRFAFEGCNLFKICSKTETPPAAYYNVGTTARTYYYVFDSRVTQNCTIYLPSENAIKNYQTMYSDRSIYVPNGNWTWSNFKNYVVGDGSTDIDDITVTDGPVVEVTAGGVILSGADGGTVSVYSADGRLVYGSQCYDGTTLPLQSGLLYIIVANGKPMKVAL